MAHELVVRQIAYPKNEPIGKTIKSAVATKSHETGSMLHSAGSPSASEATSPSETMGPNSTAHSHNRISNMEQGAHTGRSGRRRGGMFQDWTEHLGIQ